MSGKTTIEVYDRLWMPVRPLRADSAIIVTDEEALLAPLRWRSEPGTRVRIGADLFHEGVPDAFIDRLLAVIALTPHITYQVLTKRPERLLDGVEHNGMPGVCP